MFRRLLVAFDGSPHAQQALTEAIDLAQANRGTLTVMSVAPEPSVWALSGYDGPINVDGVSKEMERQHQCPRRQLANRVAGAPGLPPSWSGCDQMWCSARRTRLVMLQRRDVRPGPSPRPAAYRSRR
jgi:hypothetical protein